MEGVIDGMKIYTASLNYLDEIKKAEAGDVEAMIRVAFAILHGNKTEKLQPEEAERGIRYYKKAAALGDRSAMLDLGACYMDGRGVEKDVQEAIRWYEKGWDPDDPDACFCLGCVNRYDYLNGGEEVPSSETERITKAVQYFKRGAELLNSDCLYELGELYFSGIGVPDDKKKAFELFMEAFEERDTDVLSDRGLRIYLRLAECRHYGIGTEVDLGDALNYIRMFREEARRRVPAGEIEADCVIEEAEKEWIALNNDIDAVFGG